MFENKYRQHQLHTDKLIICKISHIKSSFCTISNLCIQFVCELQIYTTCLLIRITYIHMKDISITIIIESINGTHTF